MIKDDYTVLLGTSRGAKTRKKILESLFLCAKNRSQLAKELGLNWRTVARHLVLLIDEGLVEVVNFGSRKYYKLTPFARASIKNWITKKPDETL